MTQLPRTVKALAICLCIALGVSATLVGVPRSAEALGNSTTLEEVVGRIGATPLIAQGYTGAGIDVAVIDTGVEPVAGLDGADKLVVGPDLSFEAGVPELYGRDSYGHGTAMASIIAGDGAGFQGVAPGARIVSVKVADNTGAVDVTQVIAALDWVTENGRSNGLNVRVINLSYVTDSAQPYEVDPLAFAVERAWQAGYVVVVAAGNAGGQTTILGNPAADPYVIAVAAADDAGAADFTSRGSKTRMPDLLAPGDRILGLAAPQSRLVQDHPNALIDGRFLRGSGTSQATAVVSGAAALLLEQRPELTPDQVKALLILGTVDENGQGRGDNMAATDGLTEFFDLLDRETQLRAEAEQISAQARNLLAESLTIENEAVVLRGEAAVLFELEATLNAEAKRASGNSKKDLKQAAKDAKMTAEALEDRAEDLEKAVDKDSSKMAHELEKQAAALHREADQVRHDAERARVADHVREREIADSHRRFAEEMFAQAELLRSQAAALRLDASGLTGRAAELSEQSESSGDERKVKDALKDIDNAAKAYEKQAEQLNKDANDAQRAAEKALGEAAKADQRADEALAELEANIAKVFSNWDGIQLGEIDYDPRSGAGLIDVERSAAMPAFNAVQRHPLSNGSGSIELARGTNHVQLPDGSLLQGEVTFTGSTWTGVTWSGSTWTGVTWSGSTWTGVTWSGSTWSGSTWTGSTWTGSTWTGVTWSGSTWTGSTWTGSTWTGSTWTGSTWG